VGREGRWRTGRRFGLQNYKRSDSKRSARNSCREARIWAAARSKAKVDHQRSEGFDSISMLYMLLFWNKSENERKSHEYLNQTLVANKAQPVYWVAGV